jgi:hypothetical protein
MKKMISRVSLAVAALTFPLATYAVNVTVTWPSGTGTGTGWGVSNQYNLPEGSILGILSNLLFWLLSVFAILGIVGFVISGIMYLLAGVNEDLMEKGKDGMKWSIIGIIVGLSGFVIMQAVSAMLTGASSSF